MTYGLGVWDAVYDNRAVVQTSNHDDVLDKLGGRVVVIDAANQAQFGQGRSVNALGARVAVLPVRGQPPARRGGGRL